MLSTSNTNIDKCLTVVLFQADSLTAICSTLARTTRTNPTKAKVAATFSNNIWKYARIAMYSFLPGGPPRGDNDRVNQYDDNNGEWLPLPPSLLAGLCDSDSAPFAETTAEVGTIAGIVSAVAMALMGAVTSYISYQKKKLCFSIQRKGFFVVFFFWEGLGFLLFIFVLIF